MYEPLSVGNKVEFVPFVTKGKTESDPKITYVSQILDTDEEGIVCAMPIVEGRLIPIEIGTAFETFFYTAKGIYKVDCDVTERKKEGSLYTLTVVPRETPQKFQRREFFRLDCTKEVAVKKLSQEEMGFFNEKKLLPDNVTGAEARYVLIDISGGGMRMLSREMFHKGDLIEIRFPLEIAGRVVVKRLAGFIISSTSSKNNRSIYDNRIQFKYIRKEDSEDIVKYIFEQQRLMRKKERG